ncbi:hypothetical protein [Methanoplanus endosymbiosus]|uniref:Uncharacterized protein n=1 Tax=Methanoplanus endosymbiosus TaxID=33865 RepID=A0A9E7PMM7_9EURY|nr:hypothetical protein [Methanoplanus endosymbiosus]UUX93035.1 hypothetical protein L6E24_02610 [Methanoplanus endosymbiosus]
MITCGCTELPEEIEETFLAPPPTGTITPPPTPAEYIPVYVNYSTPVPTPIPEARPTYTNPPEDMGVKINYSLIYDSTHHFKGDVISFDYDLIYPPMIIEYDATTVGISDTKSGKSQFGDKDSYSVTTTNPNPAAFYYIRVYDDCSGELIKETGIDQFAKLSQRGEMKIFAPGKMHIELYGNIADVKTKIHVAPDNINATSAPC